jgi:hypothetical protein
MKKKIINGIMMVALVAATSTSFVSCKDTNEDVRIEQDAKIEALERDLALLDLEVDALDTKYGGICSALDSKIDGVKSDLTTAINAVSNKAADNSNRIAADSIRIDNLKDEVNQLTLWLTETFAKLVTNVEISGTYNNMLGSVNIPGFEPKMLINNYGIAAVDGSFPKSDLYKGEKIEWVANQVLGAGSGMYATPGFAGYIYANVNRYIDMPLLTKDQDSKSIFKVTLANTAGEDVKDLLIVNMDETGKPTTDVLQWGWTRADENNIFKFGVAYIGDEPASFTPAKIDLSKFKADLKAIWKDRNRQSGTSKQALGHLVADLYYNLATKDTNMKKYMLKFAWKDNTAYAYDKDGETIIESNEEKGLQHIATSEAELVFATIKPLGFNSGEAIAENVDNITKSANNLIEKMEPYIDKIFNRIKKQINLDKLNFPEDTFDAYYDAVADKYYFKVDKNYINSLITTGGAPGVTVTFNDDLKVDITDMAEDITKAFGNVNDFVANMKNLLGKFNGQNVTNWVEKFTNKFDKLIKNNADQMLQPVLLAIDKNGNVNRVSGIKSAPYEAEGEVRLEATSYTAELFAPAYVKFVGCKDITADGFNELNFSNSKVLKFTPEKGKLYEIVYEAADYSGNIKSHTYYIQGK